jgi:peptidoglycan/LPS O-acetylase OafA/YrhL
MGLVLNERYDRPALNRSFYVNRALRIYSLYFVALLFYVGIFALIEASGSPSPLQSYVAQGELAWPDRLGLVLLNISVVGQDLTFWLKNEGGHLVWCAQSLRGGADAYRLMLVPTAWSLSLEICFYALAPFIVRRPTWQIATIAGMSFALRIVAALAGWSFDPYSYRFFPFELALFLAGTLAYRAWAAQKELWNSRAAKALAALLPCILLVYPLLPGSRDDLHFFTSARVLTLALVAVALPAVHGWSRNLKVDRTVGELSYPLYLSHVLVAGLVSGIAAIAANHLLYTGCVLAVSFGASWLIVRVVDAPVEALRRRLADRARARIDENPQNGGDMQLRLA